jgi:hypothetical protein
MCHTVQRTYLGWDITIRCSTRAASTPSKAATYTAMAVAELRTDEDPSQWVDARLQLINTGNRSWSASDHCVDDLFDEVKQLIDALKI